MAFVAAAFCPHPPLLVPEVAAGEVVAVRAPAVAAVRWLTREPIARVIVLGSADRAAFYPSGSVGGFAGYGVQRQVRLPGPPVAGSQPLPLPLAVAGWLLEDIGCNLPTVGLACDPAGGLPSWPDGDHGAAALLVMGDGSARRSEKAPGWLDGRSVNYDAGIGAALAEGDPALLATDLALGAELLAAGAPAWAAAAGLLSGGRWKGEVSYDDAPYGVGYLVATWSNALGT